MSIDSTENVALITGSNRGIGLEVTQQLARRGFHVVIAARNEASGRKAASDIVRDGGRATFLPLDVSNSDSIENAAAQFGSVAGHLNGLINNAGIYPDEGVSVLTLSRGQLKETFDTNTFGPLEVTQAFLPYLRRADSARVINVSSGYGQLDGMSPDVPSYCLSKHALNGLTIMLVDALRADDISVNALCPGWVRTDMEGSNATLSVEEGADTAIWLAQEAPHELTGKLFRERQEVNW
ncbi:SDR family NAD(P)-dependent oxidoreductase [Aeoliella sp. ICT_H6.2]|uniref:SDR family NAD(P)-dependent oxidoreductase n=1 Tax=Aeoliella straminimaris TaxID=2954799 RepID=A0A9X2FGM9_9BACT|nr:SDR family NAD(P)-dependent oxidoreductase [Aeoliella straminimaris]MCO6045321.1 SDR family NAD(P)-dependent oxidoreductase [Aeoliella straminimaris]